MADALKNTASGATNTVQQGAQAATDTAKQGAQGAQNAASGTDKWNAMTEDQKKQTFDQLPDEQKKGKSYTEWIKEGYQHQYENWMPWIEDMYLRWFTNDNKASYATKGKFFCRAVVQGSMQDAFLLRMNIQLTRRQIRLTRPK